MTLLELQNILGERIKIATDENMKPQDRNITLTAIKYLELLQALKGGQRK